MLNNDLSNRQAPSLLFRLDDFIVTPKVHTMKDKLKNLIKGDLENHKLEPKVVKVVYDIFRYTDFTTGVVVLESEWKKYSQDINRQVIDLPIKDIYVVHTHFDIYTKLQEGEYLFYIDDNTDNHTLVGHHACITLQELTEHMRRK